MPTYQTKLARWNNDLANKQGSNESTKVQIFTL
ncbi:hypothetical protein SAMN05421856_102426 [Chryseobacterium taichungense]|uniref:Uncharacterized protein n=1 Tax=Chryseobacterium taichungense TaxID=295069 RepID=A0A1H7XII6_9FLAO|nr:hypothetical protein SAMN05421856_102426 [Chryseobacterium taichungense]